MDPFGIALSAIAFAASPSPAVAAARPSVVLITLDTTRADRLGCYGASGAETPNLDALARRGTLFESALSPAPLTLPAHASLMTGRVPRRHAVRDNTRFRLGADPPLLAEALRERGYRTQAFVSAAVLDRGFGLARGFDGYDDEVRIGDREAFDYEERAASQTNDRALAALPGLEPPYFLWVHYFDPHLPYVPPEPFRTRFRDRPYDGEIAFLDRELGRLVEAVRAKGGPAILVVAGDHGEGLGEHGESSHGTFLYQGTQRVPLLLSGPGIPAGRRVAATVSLVDVAPTVLDLLGLDPLEGADGASLAPLLLGDRAGPDRDFEMETFFPRFAYGWAPVRALVRGPLKYVSARKPELYDLREDPSETSNLAPSRPETARALGRRLARLVSGDDPRPAPPDPEMAELVERLESLGYAAGSPSSSGGPGVASSIDPKDGIAWIADLESARRDIQAGAPRDGIPKLERLLGRNPDNPHALLALAQCFLASGEPERAVPPARRAVSLAPDDATAWLALANGLAASGGSSTAARDPARGAYEKALALDPRGAEAYLAFAAHLVGIGRPDDARRLLEKARGAGVSDPDLETELGLLEAARGSGDAAKAAFERALRLDPEAAVALESLGKLAYARGNAREAAGFFSRALEAEPKAPVARTLGAILLYDLGDRAQAREAFRKAVALAPPGDPETATVLEILSGLAEATDSAGRPVE